MNHILLIDDDPALVPEQVRQMFAEPAYRVTVAPDGATGLAVVQSSTPPDVILLDMRLPDRSGLEVYEEIRRIDARIPVIFITVSKAAETAIEAMKSGAFNYLFKPLDLANLHATVTEALEVARRMREPVVLGTSASAPSVEGGIVGSSPEMLEVYKAIGRVAGQDVTVLITGESGTGKEVIARAIYQHSARSKAPFFALNCAAIPEQLLESELFGHERGAFTSADRRRIGKFEQYSGGTVLLDEIGDMPVALQVKLLRLLQEQTFERVGGNESITTDIRLIAATHRDLKSRAADEKFRSDLYYRLGVFTIHLPPLRERGADLQALALHFTRRFSQELDRDVHEIAPDAMGMLEAYPWPGNVRELQSVIKQALLRAKGSVLLPAFLPELSAPPSSTSRRATPLPPQTPKLDLHGVVARSLARGDTGIYADAHRETDRVLFTLALDHTRGNHREAARVLGISRQTMRVKMRALGLTVSHSVEEIEDDPSEAEN